MRRRYSVRSVDAHGDQLTLWVTTGHSGIGASWVESLKLRDEVELIGPRGKIGLDPVADWHLFVGDASGFGAFYRMAESIEPPGQAIFVVELETMDDAVTPRLDADISPTAIFVERAGRAPGDPSGLLSALALLELPVGDGHAYLFGELATVRVVREALCDRGLDGGQIEMKAFWRAGVGNLDHGEPPKSD